MSSYQIRMKVEALKDLNSAVDWYNEQKRNLGIKFQQQVVKQINSLKTNPQGHSTVFTNVRCLVIKQFPFVVHYTVNDSQKMVDIFSVFHTNRDPDILDKRL